MKYKDLFAKLFYKHFRYLNQEDLKNARASGYAQGVADVKKTLYDECGTISTEIFTSNGKQVFLGGEQISKQELADLKGEVSALKEFRLWNIFHQTLRDHAIKRAIVNSQTFEEVLAGKMMLHNLGIQRNIVDQIDKVPMGE